MRSGRAIQADAERLLLDLPPASVDAIITDPAYASLDRHRARGTTTRLQSGWFPTIPDERLTPIMRAAARALSPTGHVYVMADDPTARVVMAAGEAAGLRVWKALTWVKVRGPLPLAERRALAAELLGDSPPDPAELVARMVRAGMGYHWRTSTERIVFMDHGRGARRLRHLGWPDVIAAARVRGGFPTEKPAELVARLIENSTAPGDLVVDPFAGSGVVGVEAARAGRRWILGDVDISPAIARLAAAGVPLESEP